MGSFVVGERVDLLETAAILHEHLTGPLCESVFDEVREGERRRHWVLERLMAFWTAVVLRAPPSLTHALAEASSGAGGAYPQVRASDQAFFSRCQSLSWEFFAKVFEKFSAQVASHEPARFFAQGRALAARFRDGIYVVDGSSLDAVARRLKLLWDDRRVVLPGSIVAFYDLSRGTVAGLRYDTAIQGREQPMAREGLAGLSTGALVLGDRLFGLPWFFQSLKERGLFGLCRRNRLARMVPGRRLSRRRTAEGTVEDVLVEVGAGSTDVPPQELRLIRSTRRGRTIELLSNVLDPARLAAREALDLYRRRWVIERLFFDLKEVLNLHRFYAANANAVAMQVYAAAIVHVALRTAQGRIAHRHEVEPEEISTAKLFPKVAVASAALVNAEWAFEAVRAANPRVRLRKPEWRAMPGAWASLSSILVRRRTRPDDKLRPRPGRWRRRGLPPPPPRPGS